jgi:hypothetical protein
MLCLLFTPAEVSGFSAISFIAAASLGDWKTRMD